MLATDRWLLAAGLLAKGYSVNETDPAKLAEVRDSLIAAKKTLLAYDDTTFYAKLVSRRGAACSGVGRLVQLRHRREQGHQVRHPGGGFRPLARHHGR